MSKCWNLSRPLKFRVWILFVTIWAYSETQEKYFIDAFFSEAEVIDSPQIWQGCLQECQHMDFCQGLEGPTINVLRFATQRDLCQGLEGPTINFSRFAHHVESCAKVWSGLRPTFQDLLTMWRVVPRSGVAYDQLFKICSPCGLVPRSWKCWT